MRRLERKAFETLERSDILAYWSAALRAGEVPKPTVATSTNYAQIEIWSARIYLSKENELYLNTHPLDRAPRVLRVSPIKEYGQFFHEKDPYLVQVEFEPDKRRKDPKQLLAALQDLLAHEMQQENPRRNPDDDLRKLQRQAARGSASDVLKYFAAAWRAGEEPRGNVQLVGTEAFTGYASFRAPLQFWVFGNGWGLSQYLESYPEERLYYMLFKLSTKSNSSIYVDTPIGRWVDLDWRDLARVERYTPVWAIAERGSWRLSEPEMLDLVANLRARPKDVVGFADRLGGA